MDKNVSCEFMETRKDLYDECVSLVTDIRNELSFGESVNATYALMYYYEQKGINKAIKS
jgi:hypothetical protein